MFRVHFSTTPNLSALSGPMGNAYRAAAKDALAQTGGHVRGLVRRYIESGGAGWRGLSSMTLAMRSRVLSPLFNLAQLVRFKVNTSSGKLRVQIGFFPTAKKKKAERAATGGKWKMLKGRSAAAERARFKTSMGLTQEQLARKHEFGQQIRVTKAMRRALAAMGHPLKKTTTTLPVPARPTISTVYRQNAAHIENYFQEKFAVKLKTGIVRALGRTK